jgi:hypothetical protein
VSSGGGRRWQGCTGPSREKGPENRRGCKFFNPRTHNHTFNLLDHRKGSFVGRGIVSKRDGLALFDCLPELGGHSNLGIDRQNVLDLLEDMDDQVLVILVRAGESPSLGCLEKGMEGKETFANTGTRDIKGDRLASGSKVETYCQDVMDGVHETLGVHLGLTAGFVTLLIVS